ncbi:MAG TPA: tyrosine--tRNA ligase [Chloroflexota bacterium]|nr:tyrosine--tRNA ligase [Chloroflexota bacterium]
MPNAVDVLKERGFVYDVSDEAGLRAALEQPITLYDGFDPSGASLTAGHLLGIMMLAWFQRLGHRPIAIMGGGTAMIGDPSGKTSIRRVLSLDEIERNLAAMQRQMAHFLDFDGGKALMINNATWLTSLNYIDFLRDIGRHFSVNHMLGAEVYKSRLESGLTFLEMNYQVLQAYDFLHLYRTYGCLLQVGGSDQWSNILAGVDLIRRVEGKTAYALVTPLLTTASGQKMGKTEAGAIWLDPHLTRPYDFYQYFINTEDPDVEKYLALLTFLPMDQVRELARLDGAEIRQAKEVLAFEVTSIVHGEDEARKARDAARALFSGSGASDEAAPAFEIEGARLREGVAVHELFADAFGKSRRESRQTIEQGGCYLDGEPVQLGGSVDREGLLRWGKKDYRRLVAR